MKTDRETAIDHFGYVSGFMYQLEMKACDQRNQYAVAELVKIEQQMSRLLDRVMKINDSLK